MVKVGLKTRVFLWLIIAGICPTIPHASADEDVEFGGAAGLNYPSYRYPKWIPYQDFAQQDGIANAILSPDGTHMITAYPKSNYVYLHVEATEPEEQETHLSFKTDGEGLQNVHWLDNDKILVETTRWRFTRSKGFYPSILLQVFRRDQQGALLVKHFDMLRYEAYVDNLIVHPLPDDPQHVLIAASKNGKSSPSVFRLNISTGSQELIEESQKGISKWIADHAGHIRFGFGIDDDQIKIIAKPQPGSPWKSLKDNKLFKSGQFFPIMFDFDDQQVIVRSATANGRFAFYKMNLATGRISEKIFEHPNVDALGVEFNTNKKRLLAVTYLEDRLQRHYLDPEYEVLFGQIERALPNRSNYVLSHSANDRYMLIKSVSDRYPGAIYRLDMKTRELEVVREINPALNPLLLAPTRRVNYFARDGLEIPAYLTMPLAPKKQKLPAVILPHPGPHTRDTADYDRMAQFLASRGYVVLQPNYRGSTGYSFEFEALGYGEWGGKIQDDLEDAAKYLMAENIADPDRVCIIGENTFDAYSALLGILKAPDVFKCGVAISPIPDLKNYIKSVKFWQGPGAVKAILGKGGSKAIKEASPLTYADKLSRPLMVFFGGQDWLIPNKDIIKLEAALKESGTDFDLLFSDREGHGISSVGVRISLYKRLEAFLAKHIGSPDQTGFEPEAQVEVATASKNTIKKRAQKLKLDELLGRCIPKQYEPFFLVSDEQVKPRITYCKAYQEANAESHTPQTALSILLTKAKLKYLDQDIEGFSKDLAEAKDLVTGTAKGSLQKASLLAIDVLDILAMYQVGQTGAALEAASTLSASEPDYMPGHELLLQLAFLQDAFEEYFDAQRRKLALGFDDYDAGRLVRGLVRTANWDAVKKTVENYLTVDRKVGGAIASMVQAYGEAELHLGNLENAGFLLGALQHDRSKAEIYWDHTFPNIPDLKLRDLKNLLRSRDKEELDILRTLYFLKNGAPEKAREITPKQIDLCSTANCWKVNRQFALLAGDGAEIKSLTRLINKKKATIFKIEHKDWDTRLVRWLPAVPLDVLQNGVALPKLERVSRRGENRLRMLFEIDAATDKLAFLQEVMKIARKEAKKQGASAFAILNMEIEVTPDRLRFSDGNYAKARLDEGRVEILLIKETGSTNRSPDSNWLLHAVP